MFSYYPRPQPAYYQPSPAYYGYQPSPYARALAQQQQQQRARAQQLEQERLLAQQRAARASRYFPEGYDYEPDEEDDSYYNYYTPRQRALLEAQRRQEALEQRKREAAARALHERAAMKQEQPVETLPAPRTPSPPPSASQPPASTSTPPSPSPSPPSPSPELLNSAATKIQSHYRTHRALLTISSLLAQFDALKREFVFPSIIDYQSPSGGVVSVSVPPPSTTTPHSEEEPEGAAQTAKLAYTPTNRPLHTYTELLARLLVSLDAVESRGAPVVRERRRAAVRRVEGEAGRVEGIWRGVWAGYVEKQVRHQEEQQEEKEEEGEEGEVEAMVVEPTPELTDSAMVVEEERATPELTASLSDSDSDSDSEQELLPTPVTTPIPSPHFLPLPEFKEEEDGVVVDRVLPGDEEKVEDFVVV